MNNLAFLKELYSLLEDKGIHVWVLGGWAEELHKLIPPREHKDIDLLYSGPNLSQIDTFIKQQDLKIIKSLPHKLAFLYKEIVIEIFLIKDGITNYFDSYEFKWPESTLSVENVEGLRICSIEALSEYRKNHDKVEELSRDYDMTNSI